MVVFLFIPKAAFGAEFTSVPPRWRAELSPEVTAPCSALGHPLHHAEAASKPSFCGLIQACEREQLVTNCSLKAIFNCNKSYGLHCSSPAVFSAVNFLQSAGASAFPPVLRLASWNQLMRSFDDVWLFQRRSAWTCLPHLHLLHT